MKSFIYIIFILFLTSSLFGQNYLEDFNTANKGILSGPCTTSDPTSCNSFDFTGVDWTMGGDLSGIDSEGFFTTGGALRGADIDERACWISPTLFLSGSSSDLAVSLEIPAISAEWDNSPDDYMDVEYSIDGGGFTMIPNVHGCNAAGQGADHTVSGHGCGILPGGTTYSANATGLTGTTINIQVCLDCNFGSEFGQINSVSVTNAALPVELIDFTARLREDMVQLDWQTATEINNDYFSIERSTDGRIFEEIDQVDGADNSQLMQAYQFIDKNPPASKNVYYRLRQVDHGGAYEYSAIKSVQMEIGSHSINIQPNPMTDQASILFGAELREEVSLSVYNTNGHLLKEMVIPRNSTTFPLPVSELPEGYYLLNLQSNSINETQPFIKMD